MNFLYVYVEMSIRQITGELPRYIGLNALNIFSISTSIDGVGWSCLRVPFESIDLSDYCNWNFLVLRGHTNDEHGFYVRMEA